MMNIGIDNVHSFDFMDPPSSDDLIAALRQLKLLGAINDDNKLNQTPNPGLNERGLAIAIQACTLFSHDEWKLFRKFLEKNFAKTV